MDRESVLQTALACGASGAVVIPGEQIVLSARFREICATGQCGGYGRCWMCPPEIGDIQALMDRVRSYPWGVLYQSIRPIEDSFDIEGMFEAGSGHAQLSLRIQRQLRQQPEDFLHLSCGGCHLCPTCAKQSGAPCRHPEDALPGMEGYGIDVYATTQGTPLKYINGQNTVTYFGLVLLQE